MAQEKRYSFAAATRVGEVLGQVNGVDVYGANATISGFAAGDVEVGQTNDGKKVVNVSLPLNNTGKKITGALGLTEAADETLWVRVAFFDNDNVNLATRAEKAIAKGKLLIVNGYVKAREYKGKVYFDMTANNFKISWSKDKGRSVGGEYSWVSARKANKEGNGIIALEGFVGGDPELKVTPSGKELMSFSMAVNKGENNLRYPLGIDKADEPRERVWITINAWKEESNSYLFDRVAKAVKAGQGLLIHGMLSAKEGEKGHFYNVNLNDFDVLRAAGEKNGGGEGADTTQAPAPNVPDIQLDEDIPF